MKSTKAITKMKKYSVLYFMCIPGMLYLLINNYLPMGGLVIAFKEVDFRKGLFNGDWVGFSNFKYLFATKDAWVITRNTLCYNFVFIVLTTLLSVFVAILLAELNGKRSGKFYQTAILLPYLISMVIISYIGQAFLSTEQGFINNSILNFFGIESISWYMESKYWPFILTFIKCWQQVGYLSVIYLSTILSISKEYYEVAQVEGATRLQKMWYITLPLVKPTVITMVLMSIGRIFYADFGLFYQVPMNSGAIYSTTNVLDTYVYRGLMQLGDISMSSAACFYQSIVGFILVLFANYIVRKISPEEALF